MKNDHWSQWTDFNIHTLQYRQNKSVRFSPKKCLKNPPRFYLPHMLLLCDASVLFLYRITKVADRNAKRYRRKVKAFIKFGYSAKAAREALIMLIPIHISAAAASGRAYAFCFITRRRHFHGKWAKRVVEHERELSSKNTTFAFSTWTSR